MVLAALAAFVVHASGARTPSAHSAAAVAVTKAAVTKPLPDNYLGLALEYGTIPEWVGSGKGTIDPPLVQLIRNLDPSGHPLVRVGGQSTDRAWWPVPGLKEPLGVTYTLSNAWASSARALTTAISGQLMLGLNLEADQPRIAQQEASHLLSGVGSSAVQSFALGNEPELYTSTPWYRMIGGKPAPWFAKGGTLVHSRPASWAPATFDADFARMSGGLPNVPLAGPESGNPTWMRPFATRFVSAHSRVRMLTLHAYGNNGCFKTPSNPGYPSIAHLLGNYATSSLLAGAGGSVAMAHRDGAMFRIDELGSVSCNGKAGVSNTMASALWVLNSLFSLARSGVDGVNLHSFPNSLNGLFDFKRSGGQWRATVHPLYYGALMFARAAPTGSRLVRVATHSSAPIRSWATLGTDHLVRVVLINDSLKSATSIALSAPSGYGSAAAPVQQLRAASASAQGGITLGGRSFANGTTTGVLAAPIPQSVSAHNGTYTVSVPAASATLLTLSPAS